MKTRTIQTNGIQMHISEAGEGPLVILCHGFPELGYSWRHQLQPLAEAGYRAVAPDQRGYGRSERPAAVEAYDMIQLTTDIVGLVAALGETEAVIVGHDFGSMVAQSCALLRPDLFKALALMSVPYFPRQDGDLLPTRLMDKMTGDGVFYINYFQEPGRVEAELEADVRQSVLMMLYSASGDAVPNNDSWRFVFGKQERFIDTATVPDKLPPWLTEADIDVYTEMFSQSGFSGPVNWYRNLDRNWQLTPFLTGARILQPTLFVEGEFDAVRFMYSSVHDTMKQYIPDLREIVTLKGCGHWMQQEQPEAVNRALIGFLSDVTFAAPPGSGSSGSEPE